MRINGSSLSFVFFFRKMTFRNSALEYKCKVPLNIFESLVYSKPLLLCKHKFVNAYLTVTSNYSHFQIALVFIFYFSNKKFKYLTHMMQLYTNEKFIMILENEK